LRDCGLCHLRVIALCLRHCGKADLSAYAFSVLICLYLRAGLRVKFVLQFYGSGFDGALLSTQLELFTSNVSEGEDRDQLTLLDIETHICSFLIAA